jgi:hypothetical protein
LCRAFHALKSEWSYSILDTVKGGAVKVKRKVVIAGADKGGQRMGRMLL